MKLALVIFSILLFGSNAAAEEAKKDENAMFVRLKSLVGAWEAKEKEEDGEHMRTEFKMTSGGTAIEETFNKGSQKEMVSVYHPDGDAIVMTHYCMLGNQPRMKLESADANSMHFRFQDITNLEQNESHMREMKLTFVDDKHMRQDWTFFDKGKEELKTFNYVKQ